MTIISLVILVIAFGAQIILRFFAPLEKFFLMGFSVRFIKTIFIFAIVAVFSLLIYYSYQQYVAWASVEPSKFLLPPYQNIDYFIQYVGARLFSPYLISLIAALVFFYVAQTLNKKYEERFFELEELWLGALAIFIIGHPGWFFYFIGLILIYLLIHIFLLLYSIYIRRSGYIRSAALRVSGHGSEVRLSLYYWWLPLAIFVIIINKWLIGLGLWRLLKI